jgi:branched-chain amino acid transport system permease protein
VNYAFDLMVGLGIYTIAALGLNVVTGYCGMLTLAQAGYFAVGAYTYALASTVLGWNALASAALGVASAALLSLAVSLPAWRFRGDSYVVVSLAVQVLLVSGFSNWYRQGAAVGSLANLTNGVLGIPGVPRPTAFGVTASSVASMALTLALLCLAFCRALLRSPWGRLLKCMRDDELATRGLAKNVHALKIQAMAFSCAMIGLAGALYASYVSFVDPALASLDNSVLMLAMLIVGGMGNLTGPVAGAFALIAIPVGLRFAHIPDAVAANVRLGMYGVLLVVMMRLRPQGLAGEYRFE